MAEARFGFIHPYEGEVVLGRLNERIENIMNLEATENHGCYSFVVAQLFHANIHRVYKTLETPALSMTQTDQVNPSESSDALLMSLVKSTSNQCR